MPDNPSKKPDKRSRYDAGPFSLAYSSPEMQGFTMAVNVRAGGTDQFGEECLFEGAVTPEELSFQIQDLINDLEKLKRTGKAKFDAYLARKRVELEGPDIK
jgi:hypothetical protein